MISKRQILITVVNILLLLSLHVPPADAVRDRPSQGEKDGNDLGQVNAPYDKELAKIFQEVMAEESIEDGTDEDPDLDPTLLEDDGDDEGPEKDEEDPASSMVEMDQALEDAAESQGGWCWGSKTMRWYHFELNITDKGQYAVEFVRSPKEPRLVLYPNKGWAVKGTGDLNLPLDWILYDVPGKLEEPTIMIDFTNDVKWIKKVSKKGSVDGIELVFSRSAEGPGMTENFEFTGGIYFPEKLLGRVVNKKAKTVEGHHAQDKMPSVSTVANALGVGGGLLGGKVRKWTGSFALQGGGYGLLAGFGLSYGFSSAVMLMNACLNSFLASIGMAATVQVSIGIAPLTVSQVLSFTTTAGTIGLAAGVAIGLGIGVVAGLLVAVPTVIKELVKQRKEFRLTASEKLFEKLKCHKKITRCHGDTVLVPKGGLEKGRCPKRKDVLAGN